MKIKKELVISTFLKCYKIVCSYNIIFHFLHVITYIIVTLGELGFFIFIFFNKFFYEHFR